MNLIIVESPTKARTLGKFLGKEYLVEASMGHVKDLPKSKLSVDVENNFEPDYQVVDSKKKQIAAIRKAAKSVDVVYLATDPDREGEAISAHVDEILKASKEKKLKGIKTVRIVFHEITKEAVEHAIDNPSTIDKERVDAQIARRVLDRLVGYKLSPLLWKKVRRGLSAGRVQTVTVRLIVEREREIEAFKPDEYWEIFADVKSKTNRESKQKFTVKLAQIDGKTADVKDEKTAKLVTKELNSSDYKVAEVKRKEVSKSSYPPFTTSTMTQAGANLYGYSTKKTMSLAQKLYEEGLITYHRTDSTNVAASAISGVRNYIQKEFGKSYLPEKPKYYKTKSKSAQEAHEAIRPTNVSVAQTDVGGAAYARDAGKLYELIWRRFVASQMTNAIFDSLTVEVLATHDGKDKYLLRVSGQTIKFDGWRKVIPQKAKGDVELPNVNEGDALDLLKVDPQQKFTQPPPRYNEASLVKTLEKLGIGRPSTYAPIISTIQLRNYVEKEERNFVPTIIGITVNDFLIGNFEDTFEYSFTADMEDQLDQVATGKREWHEMMGKFYKPFDKKITSVEKNAKRVAIPTEKLGRKCPTCLKEKRTGKGQGDLVIRTGRFGKFISCSLFPECKHTEKLIQKYGMKCPNCVEEGLPANKQGEVIIKTTRKGRKFFGCSRYPDCDWASWKKPVNKKKKEEGK